MVFLSAHSRTRNISGARTTTVDQGCRHFTILMIVKNQAATPTKIQTTQTLPMQLWLLLMWWTVVLTLNDGPARVRISLGSGWQ